LLVFVRLHLLNYYNL